MTKRDRKLMLVPRHILFTNLVCKRGNKIKTTKDTKPYTISLSFHKK